MAIPTFTIYTLGTILIPSGTLKILLHSTDASLTVPDDVVHTLTFDDFISEGYGTDIGFSEQPNLSFHFIDRVTSAYADGFWWHVLTQTAAEIQLQLDEGSGYTHLFWGRLTGNPSFAYYGTHLVKQHTGLGPLHKRNYSMTTVAGDIASAGFDEVSLVAGDIIRSGSFECADAFVARLKDCTFAELDTAINNSTYYTEVGDYRYLEMRTVFMGMIYLAFGQAISLSNCTDEAKALEYSAAGSYKTITQLWMTCQHFLVGAGEWFKSGTFSYLGTSSQVGTLGTCYDMAKNILRSHAVYMRHDYNLTTHTIALVGKGSPAGSPTYLTEAMPEVSKAAFRSQIAVRNIDIERWDGLSHGTMIGGTYDTKDTLPDNVDFDLKIHASQEVTTFIGGVYGPMHFVSGGVATIISAVRYVTTGTTMSSDTTDGMTEALAKYYEARFGVTSNPVLREYERQYNTVRLALSGVSTHANAKIGLNGRAQIDPGTGSAVNFIATQVMKNPVQDKLSVIWIQAT